MNAETDEINRGDSRGFHETINKRGRETLWTHCRGKSDKDVNFLVQLRVDTQGSKGLRSALTETDVAETGCTGDLENMFYRVRNVVPRKVIDGKVPKLERVWIVMDRLFRVLVAAIVSEPDIIAQLCENKGDRTFRACETNPYL